mgnify:CR=1 FL=1
MATLSEMFIGSVNQQNVDMGKTTSDHGAAIGAQLAQMQQQKQQHAAALAQKQQELEAAKYEKVGNWFDMASKMPEGPDKKAFKETFIPNGIQAVGLQDKIHPMVLEMMTKNSKIATGVTSAIRQGKVPVSVLGDPEAIAKDYPELLRIGSAEEIAALTAEYPKMFGEAEEQSLDRVSQEKRTQLSAAREGAASMGRQGRYDDAKLMKLEKRVADLGIPGLKNSMTALNEVVPGGLDGWKPGTDIPGISGKQGVLPTNRLTGSALQIRNEALSIGNQIIKMRTGAAMSEGEAGRILGEIGLSPTIGEGGRWTDVAWKGTTSAEAFINGMKRARSKVAAQEKALSRAFGADAYNQVAGDIVGTQTIAPDMQAKARAYLQKFPNGKDAARARKLLGE